MTSRGVKDFLGKPAPPGYIAGLGRGATGFITRPDLGPGSSIATPAIPAGDDDRPELQVANEEGLLAAQGPQGADDDEADAIFASIEQKMSERRQGRRQIARQEHDPNDPMTLFAAEKLKLRQVTANEWAQLPESGDFRAKRMKKVNERERYTPVPDSVILGASSLGGGMLTDQDDTDFRNVGESRERILGARIDMSVDGAISDLHGGSVDASQYLSSLQNSAQKAPQVNDLKRARTLLRAAVQSNPTNPAAWISAAKIEEVSGSAKRAREVLAEALEACPDSEDVWMEAVRLASPNESSEILSTALTRLPSSAKLWIMATERENDPILAKRALRKALEANPEAASIWKALIEREEDANDARVLLNKAVDCCPNAVDLWIALAHLESHENARKILNKARQLNPSSVEVWLAAARLEEAHGNADNIVEKILQRAVKELAQRGVKMDRTQWLREAASCEEAGDIVCTRCLVATVMHSDLDGGLGEDPVTVLLTEAKAATADGHPILAKCLLEQALERCADQDERVIVWKEIVDVDPREEVFKKAIEAYPDSDELWLKYASFQEDACTTILSEACQRNPTSERLWVSFCSKLIGNGLFEQARQVFAQVCGTIQSEKIWKNRIQLEMFIGNAVEALRLSKMAINSFPHSERLWRLTALLDGTLWEAAITACPKSPKVLIEVASQVARTNAIRARAILEKGRQAAPSEPSVWVASVNLELKELDSPGQARALMSRALQRCPLSEILWYEAIRMEARPLRKAKAMEALRRCGQEAPLILLAVARLLEAERSIANAREYYQKAIAASGDIGDAWAHFWLFLKVHELEGSEELLAKAMIANPKNGPLWRVYRKEPRWWRQPIQIVFPEFLKHLGSKTE